MNLTKDRFFIDTNIIIYLFDKNDQIKRETAKAVLKKAFESGNGVLSFQVIQEFCNAALKKFEEPMIVEDCKVFVNKFLMPICAVFPGMELYNSALDIKAKTGYGFYDSLIISAALQEKCSILYTEDLQDGQDVFGIRIRNPFKE